MCAEAAFDRGSERSAQQPGSPSPRENVCENARRLLQISQYILIINSAE